MRKHKYVCNECDVEMYETDMQTDMEGNLKNPDRISLACSKCRKWAFVDRK